MRKDGIVRVEIGKMKIDGSTRSYRLEYTAATRERKIFLWTPTMINDRWQWMRPAYLVQRHAHFFVEEPKESDFERHMTYSGDQWRTESYKLSKKKSERLT